MPVSPIASQSTSAFVIKVLEGPMATRQLQSGVPVGQIWLRDRSLPYRPITFKGAQRVKTTWLPGNPVATQQVLGPTEEPTVINGMWKDRFLGPGVAQGLAALFTDLRRAGPLVEVSWGQGILDGQPIGRGVVRRGVVTNTEITFERAADVSYRIEFTWRGDDQAVAPAVLTVGVENPRQGFGEVATSLQEMLDNLYGYQDSPLAALVQLPNDIRAAVDDVAGQVEGVIGVLQTGVGLATAIVETPQVIAQRATQVAGKGADLSRQLGVLFRSVNPLTQLPADDALDFLTYRDTSFTVTHSADAAVEAAVTATNALQGQIEPEVVAEVRPPAGSDLRDLARIYYGDPDAWWIIAQYNGLDSSVVPDNPTGPSDNPAPPILVPRRTQGAASTFGC